jgi:hypothetical protein
MEEIHAWATDPWFWATTSILPLTTAHNTASKEQVR